MRGLIFLLVTAGMLTAADAAPACMTIADNSQAIRQRDGGSQDMVFMGSDARDFFAALTKLIGPTPWTPPDLNAISAHLYVGEDREKLASVHFYGADRCDVGFDADMPATLLNQIIAKVGVRI
jgi:hypothetical protein